MDIGMTLLFGGFNQRFYETYNASNPLESDWEKRVPLTQLYPLLVHLNLFGASYLNPIKSVIKTFT
jgi:fructosamine-3-kinase